MTKRAPSPQSSPAGRGGRAAIILFVFFASVALGQQEPTQVRPPAETMRPEITGARGIVAGGRNFSVACRTICRTKLLSGNGGWPVSSS